MKMNDLATLSPVGVDNAGMVVITAVPTSWRNGSEPILWYVVAVCDDGRAVRWTCAHDDTAGWSFFWGHYFTAGTAWTNRREALHDLALKVAELTQ